MPILYIVLLLMPLPFASARPIWQCLWVMVTAIIALTLLKNSTIITRPLFRNISKNLLAPCIGTAMLAVWGFLQASSKISISPYDTLSSSLYFLAHTLWFIIIYYSTRVSAKKLLIAISIIGTIYSIYGLYIYFSGNNFILWYDKVYYQSSLTSTFVNRNSFAAYNGLIVQTVFVLLILNWPKKSSTKSFSKNSANLVKILNSTSTLLYFSMFIVLLTSLFLTASRAGIISTLIATSLLAFLVRGQMLSTMLMGSLFLITAIFVFNLSGGYFEQRIGNLNIENERFILYSAIVEGANQKAISGYGLGTFPELYYNLRLPIMPLRLTRAHNDYLELIITAGFPATILFFLSFICYLCATFKWHSNTSYNKFTALGIGATIQIALHSAVDFSMQIPAVSYMYVTLLAISISTESKNLDS